MEETEDSCFIFSGSSMDSSQASLTPLLTIVKTDKLGNIIWKRDYTYYGGETQNYDRDMVITDDGDIGVTGFAVPIGVGTIYNDMFVLKVDSCGYLNNPNINALFTCSLDTVNKTISCTNQSTEYCTPLWYFGDGDSIYLNSPAHTYNDTGTYTITLVVRAGNSTDTFQQQVTILNPDSCGYYSNPSINASFTLSLDTVTYTATFANQSAGYCTSLWYFGDSSSSTLNNPVHTYSDTGIYTITLAVKAGVSTDTFQQQIRIANPLSVTGISLGASCFESCDGAIKISQTGGLQPFYYKWSNDSTTINLTSLCAGVYTVTVTDMWDTSIVSFTITQPDSFFIAVDSITPDNGSNTGAIEISITGGTPPYTFQWSNTDTTKDVTQLAFGFYSVNITDANGCTTTLQNIVVEFADAVFESEQDAIKIYPNPVKETLHVPHRNTQYAIRSITLIDISGKIILQTNETAIKVLHLATGLYFIKVQFENGKSTVRKVAVQ